MSGAIKTLIHCVANDYIICPINEVQFILSCYYNYVQSGKRNDVYTKTFFQLLQYFIKASIAITSKKHYISNLFSSKLSKNGVSVELVLSFLLINIYVLVGLPNYKMYFCEIVCIIWLYSPHSIFVCAFDVYNVPWLTTSPSNSTQSIITHSVISHRKSSMENGIQVYVICTVLIKTTCCYWFT